MSVLIPAIFTKPVFRVDNSVKLEFETREFSGAMAADLMDLRQSEGWLLFTKNATEAIEANIPDEKADAMVGTKTQAQRLRGVIYRIWEQNGKTG
jgi:hypothetical protein